MPRTITVIFLATVLASSSAFAQSHGRTWDDRNLTASGLEKCRAFRHVRESATQLQAGGGGTLTKAQQTRLEARLAAVKARAPKSVTASTCGVPL